MSLRGDIEAAVAEEALGIVRADEVDGLGDGLLQRLPGPCSHPPQIPLDLGKGQLDGGEVRRIAGQEVEPAARPLDQLPYLLILMTGEVIDQHHLAGTQVRTEELPDKADKVGGGD